MLLIIRVKRHRSSANHNKGKLFCFYSKVWKRNPPFLPAVTCWHDSPSSDCIFRVHWGVLLQIVGAGRTGNHHASAAAAGAPFNLFHEKISVVVVARANQAKFWLSYLRTKLCNSPSFPAPSLCVSPHVPLSQVFFVPLLVLENLCLSYFQDTLKSLALLVFPLLSYFCWVLRLLMREADSKRLSAASARVCRA